MSDQPFGQAAPARTPWQSMGEAGGKGAADFQASALPAGQKTMGWQDLPTETPKGQPFGQPVQGGGQPGSDQPLTEEEKLRRRAMNGGNGLAPPQIGAGPARTSPRPF